MQACSFTNFSMSSGRASSPPRPTKTLWLGVEAASAAAATCAMASWKIGESWSFGISRLRAVSKSSRDDFGIAYSTHRSPHPTSRTSMPSTAAISLRAQLALFVAHCPELNALDILQALPCLNHRHDEGRVVRNLGHRLKMQTRRVLCYCVELQGMDLACTDSWIFEQTYHGNAALPDGRIFRSIDGGLSASDSIDVRYLDGY